MSICSEISWISRKWPPAEEARDCSPRQHFKRCIESSMENMHTDVRGERVKQFKSTLHGYFATKAS